MGKVAYAADDFTSFVQFDFPGVDEVWLQWRQAMNAAALFGFFEGEVFLMDGSGNLIQAIEIDSLGAGGPMLLPWWGSTDVGPVLQALRWYTLGVHSTIIAGVVSTQMTLDGIDLGPIPDSGPTGFGQHASLDVGGFFFGATGQQVWVDNIKLGTAGFGSTDIFATDFESGIWVPPFTSDADVADGGPLKIVNDPVFPPLCRPALRPPRNIRARLIVTDLNGVVTTWLERNHLGATVNANLDQPWQIAAAVRGNDPAVHTLFTDGYPLLAQSNRLVYVLLREAPAGSGVAPWVCEASGILMSPQDQADADIGTSHFVAYDPWQYLKGVPCFNDDDGGRIPPGGRFFSAAAFPDGAAQIAAQLLSDSILSLNALGYGPATGPFIDLPLHDVGGGGGPYAGSGFYNGGGVHPTPPISFTVQQGSMLGDVWDQLVAAGSDITGTSSGCDIVLEPLYDPALRPGFTSQLAVYPLAGVERPEAPMAWARFTRTAVTADRQHDGTPSAFINVALFGAGQGGADGLGTIQANALAIAAFYSYWAQQFFPGQPIVGAVNNLAIQALHLHKQGTRTYLVDPDPLRAGVPLRDYAPGDRVNVLAPNSLRVTNAGYHRVQTIPLQINPDGVVMVSQLLTCPDWRGDDRSALSLAPTFGAAGTAGVTIIASNFAALHALTVHVGGVAATITGGGTTNGSGDTTITFTIPASLPLGDQTVYVSDGSSTATSPTPFTVT
jgi:hypothetical protein